MKKILGVIFLSLVLAGNTGVVNADVTFDKYRLGNTLNVKVTCVNGYKFVIVQDEDGIAVTQYFIEKDGNSVPAKCS